MLHEYNKQINVALRRRNHKIKNEIEVKRKGNERDWIYHLQKDNIIQSVKI